MVEVLGSVIGTAGNLCHVGLFIPLCRRGQLGAIGRLFFYEISDELRERSNTKLYLYVTLDRIKIKF